MPELWRTSWRLRAAQLFDTALHLILPPVCVSCKKAGSLFCDDCRQVLPWIEPPLCHYCGIPNTETDCVRCHLPLELQQVRATFWFSGPVEAAIHHFKYEGAFALAPLLAEMMAMAWKRDPLTVDIIVPVPLHPERERLRGYNQATLLARRLAPHLEIPVDETALERTRATRPQVGLNARERRGNVRGAFRAPRDDLAGKELLLLDDVYTTGATLAAAAAALLEAGAAGVRAFCLARAVRG